MQTHPAPGPVLKQQVLLACPNGTVLVGANEEGSGKNKWPAVQSDGQSYATSRLRQLEQ